MTIPADCLKRRLHSAQSRPESRPRRRSASRTALHSNYQHHSDKYSAIFVRATVADGETFDTVSDNQKFLIHKMAIATQERTSEVHWLGQSLLWPRPRGFVKLVRNLLTSFTTQ
ncbi:hypothetical protein HF679_09670 [Enterobacter sp. JUb54]|uniref:hypothetical protein n=1 Tax=Enterobacter sp. JUb54 TaxID=2724468 RepID=UPI00164E5F90|nr:hypothetical protein [Enterobacter sp. JUb54]QNK09670.1 hypothetical protein HF679_09670 [Enterobacter sp. JUb54]